MALARTRSIKISALNIAMHNPHSPEAYMELFRKAFDIRRVIRKGALQCTMLGSLSPIDRENLMVGFSGEIFRFVQLDPNEPWFNSKTKEEASEDEIKEILIPKHLLPHLKKIPFVFKPDIHELRFVTKDRDLSISPRAMAATFFNILNDKELTDFPEIEVTVIPDTDSLESMLQLYKLEKLTIYLKRPNPDDLGGEEPDWLRKLERQNARSLQTELISEREESIHPDEDSNSLARVASRNGKVVVKGKNAAGVSVEKSTEDIPLVETVIHNPEEETVLDILKRAVGF